MSERPVRNPLRQLVDQLGVNSGFLSATYKIPHTPMLACLAEEPKGQIKVFCQILESLGVKIRLMAADPPFGLWIDNEALDALHGNPTFRRAVGLEMTHPPVNSRELRFQIKVLREQGMTQEAVALHFSQNHIPLPSHKDAITGTTWKMSTVTVLSTRELDEDSDGSPATLNRVLWCVRWRRFVVSWLLPHAVRMDAAATLRFGLKGLFFDRYTCITADQVLPQCASDWVTANLTKPLSTWCAGKVGIGDPPDPGEDYTDVTDLSDRELCLRRCK